MVALSDTVVWAAANKGVVLAFFVLLTISLARHIGCVPSPFVSIHSRSENFKFSSPAKSRGDMESTFKFTPNCTH